MSGKINKIRLYSKLLLVEIEFNKLLTTLIEPNPATFDASNIMSNSFFIQSRV
jgi:hypothetical protein